MPDLCTEGRPRCCVGGDERLEDGKSRPARLSLAETFLGMLKAFPVELHSRREPRFGVRSGAVMGDQLIAGSGHGMTEITYEGINTVRGVRRASLKMFWEVRFQMSLEQRPINMLPFPTKARGEGLGPGKRGPCTEDDGPTGERPG